MDKKVFNMLVGSVNEFETSFNANEKATIELTRIWIGSCSSITIPDYVKTKDELLIESKALALWLSIGTDDKFSDVMGNMVDIIDTKTNANMDGLKHHLGTFKEDNKEIKIEDLLKVLFFMGIVKKDAGEGIGQYLGTVSIERLLEDSLSINYDFIDNITKFSLQAGINYHALLDCLILISCFEIVAYSKINFNNITIDEQYKDNICDKVDTHTKDGDDFISVYKSILTIAIKNYKRVIDAKLEEKKHQQPKVYYPELSQEILNNSYDEIGKSLQMAKDIKLPLDQYKINVDTVLGDVEEERIAFDTLFTNPKKVGQLEGENHHMGYLLKDGLELKNDTVVFKGHTKGLSIGYTQKAIVLSLDKNTTIRELETGLKFLKKQKGVEDVIEFNEKLIRIVRQQNAKSIPFKALAKEVGITKNQAKQYAKAIYEAIHLAPKTIENNFDKVITHDFRK